METFVILSAKEILREESSEPRYEEMLRGVSFKALVRYASTLCHHLTYASEMSVDGNEFQRFHSWFVDEFVPEPLKGEILEQLNCRPAYRGKPWAVADQHRVANLVAAYIRANPEPPPGTASSDDMGRIIQAQLIVNDLVSESVDGDLGSNPAAEVLPVFAMSRSWDIQTHLARMFDLFGERLGVEIPELEKAVAAETGIGTPDFVTILFSLYSIFLAAMDPDTPGTSLPKPSWSGGLVEFPNLDPNRPEDVAVARTLDAVSISWGMLHDDLSGVHVSGPNILAFLHHPLIRIAGEEFWSFDPGLILSAGSNGLFWRAVDAYEASGGDRQELFNAAGIVFEEYLSDFFDSVGREDAIRGDEEGEGLPDFLIVEGDTLVAVEAKSAVMRDDVKWSADSKQIRTELEKIMKNNQFMSAIGRLFQEHPEITSGIKRVVPVIVVLDPCFASPGLEHDVNEGITKPGVDCSVEGLHLLNISELEISGNYLREQAFANLLDARRNVISNHGWRSVSQVIRQHQAEVEVSTGKYLQPFDSQIDARGRFDEVLKDFATRYSLEGPNQTDRR